MSEIDYEDGGYYADQDFFAEECGKYDGNCNKCPHKYECDSSDIKKYIRENWN